MLDTMLLLNEEQVSAAIRSALDKIAAGPRHRNKRVALYAEREFQELAIFESELLPDRDGKMRWRAVGEVGKPAVKPIRGRARVGSEGLIAFLVSQQKDAWPKVFMNHPGPNRLRGKSQPAGEIVIVTDFIGSGGRICSMLDKFWAVPTIKSWVSRKLIRFRVVTAATTSSGMTTVKSHRLRPDVYSEWIAPAVDWTFTSSWYFEWRRLVAGYGPAIGRGGGRFGYGDEAALVAFSYRIPNNTPAFIHHSEGGWRALYDGPAPPPLYPLFGVRPISQIIEQAAAENSIALPASLTEDERKTVVVLSLMRGRWHRGSETALAARSGMAISPMMAILREALDKGLITNNGRLTDQGYALLDAGGVPERASPKIATNQEPYYPEALRIPL